LVTELALVLVCIAREQCEPFVHIPKIGIAAQTPPAFDFMTITGFVNEGTFVCTSLLIRSDV
jgi:hypothetical protein